ncbi:btb/poz domain-containing protein, partial [Quercus suber]
MASSMGLGSISEAFHREGQTWYCTSGLPTDVIIEVGEMSFHIHKFPLISRSGLLERLIEEVSSEDESDCVLQLDDVPGGAKVFELIAKFSYGVKIEFTALNVVSLRCAAEYLKMTEDYGEGNLISQTEAFLNEVFGDWKDSIKVLESCAEVQEYAEELHIVSRCVDSLAMKTCADRSLFNWPLSGSNNSQNPTGTVLWNGISSETRPQPLGEDWWFEDVSFLSFPLYKRLILAVELKGMKPETIAASLIYYARRHLPLMNRQSSFNDANHANPETSISIPEVDQRFLLEEIVLTSHISKLQAHPWLTDFEREQLCRLMNCQKLSLEASTHAAQNERLPLRVIVQVLFFEQLRLRTSISGWFFVDNLENSQNPSGSLGLPKNDASFRDRVVGVDDRLSKLERECSSIKRELHILKKPKRGWFNLHRLGFGRRTPPCSSKNHSPV